MDLNYKSHPLSFKVLEALCEANAAIDSIARIEGRRWSLPKIERGSITHHVHALAGILRKCGANRLTAQVGGIIVDVRRS